MTVFDGVRATLRAFAETVTPETAELGAEQWRDVENIMERALARRPARMRRQIVLLLHVIGNLTRFRYGRRFSALDPALRAQIIDACEHSRLKLLRRGIWGLRTLVFMGYYTRADVMRDIGYGATAAGWQGRVRE